MQIDEINEWEQATLELGGELVEGLALVTLKLTAPDPAGGVATMSTVMGLRNARETFEAGLAIVTQLEEQAS